jgi:hypothetical protein
VKAPCHWPLRGLQANAQALVLCGAAVALAWARAGEAAAGGRFAVVARRLGAPRTRAATPAPAPAGRE